MAPRGRRTRKVGLKRMDAAIDALSPMGFSPDLVRHKVKELLKVYDGDEGWVFIEEASYKLLIESILEDQEGEHCEEGEPSFKDSSNDDRTQGGLDTAEVVPSCVANGSLCSNQNAALLGTTTALELAPVHVAEAQSSPINNGSIRKCGPCYGWIGPQDDEDFVLLKPAPVEGQKVRRKKQKSRWDVSPFDLV